MKTPPSIAFAIATLSVLLMVAPASATITSDSNGTSGTSLSFATTGSSVFQIGTNTVTCTTWTITGTISGSTAVAQPSGTTWANCTYNIGGISGNATLTDSSAWTLSVTASLGGGSFSVSMTNGTLVWSAATCTITIPSATYSGLTWTNATHSLSASITSVSYTTSGALCPLPKSGVNGGWSMSWSEPTLTVS